MGKLAILSDLHVDINQLGDNELRQLVEVLQAKAITHVHLAGDTANKLEGLWGVVKFIEDHQISVTYNFGNHEMPDLANEQGIEAYPDTHFLNFKSISLNASQVLLAFNGWYDYSYALEKDQAKILASKNLYWYDRFIQRELADPKTQEVILHQLQLVLDQLAEMNKQVIIATHFVPKREFIVYQQGRYARWNQLNAFLGSEGTGQLFDQYDHIQQVVFGHTHRRFSDQLLGGTIYSARPLGYFYEWQLTRNFMLENQLMTSFNPMKVRGILKHHKEAFNRFRREHLKAEFTESMTVIEY
ncbi:metallophosphoesterase [Vagococcus sp. BWB3-3]|uniref:Metallophosphoesterase n=1 Tax=Vagococcus allomyrinae TaxID=2794353 RepID=A0A940PCY6_9ENTE|nr:metallophosphoesterase [Vagococcus allomyrinae]MBP1041226.1 metallophosphoesterase [Vagococcus allomyrinae]